MARFVQRSSGLHVGQLPIPAARRPLLNSGEAVTHDVLAGKDLLGHNAGQAAQHVPTRINNDGLRHLVRL